MASSWLNRRLRWADTSIDRRTTLKTFSFHQSQLAFLERSVVVRKVKCLVSDLQLFTCKSYRISEKVVMKLLRSFSFILPRIVRFFQWFDWKLRDKNACSRENDVLMDYLDKLQQSCQVCISSCCSSCRLLSFFSDWVSKDLCVDCLFVSCETVFIDGHRHLIQQRGWNFRLAKFFNQGLDLFRCPFFFVLISQM